MTTYDIDYDQMSLLKDKGELENQEFICVSQNATVYRVGGRYRVLEKKLERWTHTGWRYTGYNGRGARWKRIVLEKDLDDYL